MKSAILSISFSQRTNRLKHKVKGRLSGMCYGRYGERILSENLRDQREKRFSRRFRRFSQRTQYFG